jgi:hypothetical protein
MLLKYIYQVEIILKNHFYLKKTIILIMIINLAQVDIKIKKGDSALTLKLKLLFILFRENQNPYDL